MRMVITVAPNESRRAARRWWLWCAAAVATTALAAGAFLVSPWYRERAEFREAMELAHDKHFDAALPVLLRFRARHPGSATAVRALALGYLHNTRRLAETRQYLDEWCQMAPGDPEPYRWRLHFWLMQDLVGLAISDAEHVLKLDNTDLDTRKRLVQLLLTDGRYQRAEQEGLHCFLEAPKDVEMWLTLAHIYHQLRQAAKSAALADQVLESEPDNRGGLKLRARLYIEAGQPERAIRLLKERLVSQNAADGTEGLFELSEALVRAGRNAEAKQVVADLQCREAHALWSKYEHRDDNLGLQERVVQALLAADRADGAIQFLTDILGRNPHAPPGTHELLAVCYERKGQAPEAAEQRRLAERKQKDGQSGR
jgi:tetratricopeptide (TPR) repeat protein